MVIFPLAPDQTIAQMWSNGARGGGRQHGLTLLQCSVLQVWDQIAAASADEDAISAAAATGCCIRDASHSTNNQVYIPQRTRYSEDGLNQ